MQPAAVPKLPRDTAVVFLTHQWSQSIGRRFARLRDQVAPIADAFVLLHDDQGPVSASWQEFLQSIGALHALTCFVPEDLPGELGFPLFGERGIMGNCHLPLLRFSRSREYRFFWQVESDVEYRGNWLDFIGAYRQTDAPFLGAHVHRYYDWPSWKMWSTLVAPGGARVAEKELLKAFLPVFRASREALVAIDQGHRDGWRGHFEVAVPTMLRRHGMQTEDLRMANACYIGPSQNPSPIIPVQSTMRWRPEISVTEFTTRGKAPLLFHPIKQDWWFDGQKVVQAAGPEAAS